MSVVLLSLAIACFICGLVGCLLPILPGPPLSFAGLLLLQWRGVLSQNDTIVMPFSTAFLVAMGVLMVMITVIDTVAPIIGVKLYGASRASVWGSLIGMIVGIFVFPPFGIVLGMLLGAVAGELYAGKRYVAAMKTGIVSLISNLILLFLKIAFSGVVFLYGIYALLQ